MGLVKVQEAAYHGTNREVWINPANVAEVEFEGGYACVTYVGGGRRRISILGRDGEAKFLAALNPPAVDQPSS